MGGARKVAIMHDHLGALKRHPCTGSVALTRGPELVVLPGPIPTRSIHAPRCGTPASKQDLAAGQFVTFAKDACATDRAVRPAAWRMHPLVSSRSHERRTGQILQLGLQARDASAHAPLRFGAHPVKVLVGNLQMRQRTEETVQATADAMRIIGCTW